MPRRRPARRAEDPSRPKPERAPEVDGIPIESTTELILRARRDDPEALDILFRRYYPIMQRLAHGRLPTRARGDQDTSDVVQITFLRALRGLKEFEPRWENAWLFYLRRVLFNYIRDEGRKARRLPDQESLTDETQLTGSPPASPLDALVVEETASAYRDALSRLSESQRQVVILRLELGWSYSRIAERLGLASPDAARMVVRRAVSRLADMIDWPGEAR